MATARRSILVDVGSFGYMDVFVSGIFFSVTRDFRPSGSRGIFPSEVLKQGS